MVSPRVLVSSSPFPTQAPKASVPEHLLHRCWLVQLVHSRFLSEWCSVCEGVIREPMCARTEITAENGFLSVLSH